MVKVARGFSFARPDSLTPTPYPRSVIISPTSRVYSGRVQRLAKFQFPTKISIYITERAKPVSAKLVIGTTVFLLRRRCENSGVDELFLGMAVLRDISLLEAEALLGCNYGDGSMYGFEHTGCREFARSSDPIPPPCSSGLCLCLFVFAESARLGFRRFS
ncbi:hypothetical protein HID58_009390, partial [Brassica napus]